MSSKVGQRGISDAEKLFVLGGVAADCRGDGRRNCDYRPCEIEFGPINAAFGSVRISSSSFEVYVGIKGSVASASTNPFEFSISPAVTCASHFNMEELEAFDNVAKSLEKIFNKSCKHAANKWFAVVPDHSRWHLYIDVLFTRMDGNIHDIAALGAKLALLHTELPKLDVIENDFGQKDFDIPNDAEVPVLKLKDCEELVNSLPTVVTVNRIGSSSVFDCDQIESLCSSCRFVLAFEKSVLSYASKAGDGCFGPKTFDDVVKHGAECAKKLDLSLNRALKSL